MPERVRCDPGGQTGKLGRHVADPVQLAWRHRADLVAAREHVEPRPGDPVPVAQQVQKLRRQHREAILAPLALLDTQQHALAVDIGGLEGHHLHRAQAGAVGHAQRRLGFGFGAASRSRNTSSDGRMRGSFRGS